MKIFFTTVFVFFLLLIPSSKNSAINEAVSSVAINNISKIQIPDTLSFCGEKIPLDNQSIKERFEREFYLTLDKEGQLILYIKRSGRYFPTIEKKLQENKMPNDLKYIAIAESALLNVVSDKGASGPWQIMSSTAKILGLRVDEYIDERYDFEKATDAALKYLSRLYRLFNNWTLAVAAYNVGESNIQQNMQFQWENSYYNLFLNEETSRFIFRIAAVKYILNNQKKFGINLIDKDLYKPFSTRIVQVKNSITNLSLWAKSQGTNYYEVKKINPWIVGKSLPSGEYNIQVPINSVPKLINENDYPYKEKITNNEKNKKSRKK